MFFDSWRHYGNLGVQRALWGFAIDIRPDGYATDVSHPPFYLPGQEFGSGNNHRAFIALDPCKPEGQACTSSIQCCGDTKCSFDGSTTMQRGLQVGTCLTPPPPPPPDQPPQPMCTTCRSCANVDERCKSAADCCDASNYCINGVCAFAELL